MKIHQITMIAVLLLLPAVLLFENCSGGMQASSNSKSSLAASITQGTLPVINLSAASSSISSGATTIISWSSTGATSCISAGGGGSGISGSFTTPPLTSNTTFTVTCTGLGGSISQTVSVSVGLGGVGIGVGLWGVCTGCDVMNNATVRNNTVYYSSTVNSGITGIQVSGASTGHVIANNTVVYASTSIGSQAANCFNYRGISLSSYSFINNNNCSSNYSSYSWEASTHGNLATWQSYGSSSGYSFDSASIYGDPNFVSATTYDFSPNTGSPLLNNGSAAHGSLTDITGATRPNPPAIGAVQ